jgi:murein L,D-transpeptidase YcbB/YkuD
MPRWSVRWAAGLALAVLASALSGGCARPPGRDTDREVSRHIALLMEPGTPFEQAAHDTTSALSPGVAHALVRKLYLDRNGRPLWIRDGIPHGGAGALLEALTRASNEGLDPAAYDAKALAGLAARTVTLIGDTTTRVSALARLDVSLTLAWLHLANHLAGGRVPHATLDGDWGPAAPVRTLVRELPRIVREDRVAESLAALAPPHREYAALRPALAVYRAIAAAGGWPAVGPGPELRRGSDGPRVQRLRQHLRLTGELAAADSAGAFDATLERAVKAFQSRHGLRPDGVVDGATQRALDVPAAWRVRQLELNLERWRWVRVPLEPRSVRVNIPDFTLALWDSGRVVGGMPVVVGQRHTPTPVFTDLITYVEVNPYWRLPKNVVADEVLPDAKGDTSWFRARHLRVVHVRGPQPREVSPDEPDWTRLWEDDFPYLVIQDPGTDNPLGTIKFMCPNEYDVYLHDSNAPGLFSNPRRAYSHGCVRVGRPHDLARYALGDTSATLRLIRDSLMVTKEHRLLRLDRAVPVHVLYQTAWVDTGGRVQFRHDLYGYDAQLDSFLVAPRTRTWSLNPDSLRTAWRARQRRDRALEP